MKKIIIPALTSLMTLLSVACATPSSAQTTKLSAPMNASSARAMLGLTPGTYEILTSGDTTADHEICGNFDPKWSVEDGNPNLTLDEGTSFVDMNRGTVYERSAAASSTNCFTSFTTKMVSHQLTYTMIENQNCPSEMTRLDSDLTVNGDVLIYNFHKTWANVKVHAPIKVQCVYKLKK